MYQINDISLEALAGGNAKTFEVYNSIRVRVEPLVVIL